MARWLQPPYELDGWRIDVANMTGRIGAIDELAPVARTIRATMAATRPDTYLVAEHCYDASADLRGDGWHGTMAYSGFTRPVWSWLADPAAGVKLMGFPGELPHLHGGAVAATMQEQLASMPWRSTAASLTLLDSHDTARFRTVANDAHRHVAAVGLLATYPGVPMVFAGDEVGLEGSTSDDGRRPMPWDQGSGTSASSPRSATCSTCAGPARPCSGAVSDGPTPVTTRWCSCGRRATSGCSWPCRVPRTSRWSSTRAARLARPARGTVEALYGDARALRRGRQGGPARSIRGRRARLEARSMNADREQADG